ncbi:MAG: 16S rRNA (cytosine(1402)-N(4))-methyltransferase RsmH [Bacilli bacterium]|nr:16S rRNA (cytosine(1402)-N(4))-methyltransferase RsmH [Bacilli bacterium]
MTNNKHIPVLLNEVIEGLNIKKDGTYVDLTLGRGGHSEEILKRLTTGLLIGVDQDEEAIKESSLRLAKYSKNLKIVKSNFVRIDEVLAKLNIKKVDGVLMDLGVSSPQFDEGDRGFSYRFDSELDMRMDQQNNPLTAKKIVNEYSLNELTRVFRDYGEEKYSYQIAKTIVKERETKPINTTNELVDIIKRSKPSKELKKAGHPAKQVFQALRIEVNDELNVLKETLMKVTSLLNKKGRLAVISFHSGEDRIVKEWFKKLTVIEGNRYDLPLQNEELEFQLVNKKVIVPSTKELEENHRSVSSKLRIIEKL